MTAGDPYERWRRSRSEPEVAPDFVDRVMAEVRASALPPRAAPALVGAEARCRIAWRRCAAAALFIAAAILGLVRLAGVTAMILSMPTGGY